LTRRLARDAARRIALKKPNPKATTTTTAVAIIKRAMIFDSRYPRTVPDVNLY
jgi:hypothetical protein